MLSKKHSVLMAAAYGAAACGVDVNRIINTNEYTHRRSEEEKKGTKETQSKKILEAKIKRLRKDLIKSGASKNEIEEAIYSLKIKENKNVE